MQVALIRHPDSRDSVTAITVDVARSAATLSLRYRVAGAANAVRVPAAAAPARADHLWQHTCFEAFIGVPGTDAYYEFNFSPSRRWAAYRFDVYRNGVEMADVNPRIENGTDGSVELRAAVDLSALADLPQDAPWHAALSAVIESADGALGYWALKHRPGKPDFHHPDCFTLELPPPSQR
jgi:hypothetical protein